MDISRLDSKESGIGKRRKSAILQELGLAGLGQRCPTHCPSQPAALGGHRMPVDAQARLGRPMGIRQVAELIGCSPWSVRHTWIPKGLPHFRSGASSKLIFYTDQVVRWIERQQKGG